MKFATLSAIVLIACALLPGCASTTASVTEKGRTLREVRHVFVLRNLKDNHGIHESIVRALKTRGLDAESGPLTMMPAATQAVFAYEDRWAWDFSNHMVYLKISARDPKAVFPYVSATYQKQVAFSTQVDDVAKGVVDELFTAK